MKIGFVGLGKLGLPCALATESKGHEVMGYDPSNHVKEIIETRKLPYMEAGCQELLNKTNIKIISLKELVEFSDMIFVSVQTPHLPKYEGITRIPTERKDFDYTFLKKAVSDLSKEIESQKIKKNVIVVSTVLPSTIEREIKPILSSYVRFCYNPFFIAMTTTIRDFLDPEFILFGVDDQEAVVMAKEFYRTINDKPFFETSIKNAELIKVLYNTFIGMKIVFANTAMEICHKIGADVDEISKALALGYRRIISDQYLSGGMGDGGSCHPRDNIALSFLSEQQGLSYDWFTNLMVAREKQTEWLASLIVEEQEKSNLPIVILGKAFKPESNLVVGSPSVLLHNILCESHVESEMFDPFIDGKVPDKYFKLPYIFFIGTKHSEFKDYVFPNNSIVIDPHRYIPHSNNYKVISIGQNISNHS